MWKSLLAGALLSVTISGQAAAQATVTPGSYHCVFFINGSLTTVPGFTILPSGAYRHQDGSAGQFTYDPAQRLIAFVGGSLDKQAALADGTGKIRIYNERRSRTVIDCDTKG